MRISIRRTPEIELIPARPRRGQLNWPDQPSRSTDSLSVPTLKSGLLGGCVYLALFLVGLNPIFNNLPHAFLVIFVIFGFVAVGLGIGLLAAQKAEPAIRSRHQWLEAGWQAGFWAGLLLGLVAMLLAAQGVLMARVGESLLSTFSPAQLTLWRIYGLLGPLVVTVRVLTALLVYGLLGSQISAVLGTVGALIYSKLR